MIEENLEGFACNRFPKGFLRKFGNFQWIHKVKWHFHYGLVSQIDWGLVYSSNDVNVAVSHFNSKLHESIDIHAPFIEKIVKGRECKWLNADIKSVMNSMNSRNQLHRKIHKKKKHKNPEKEWTKSCWRESDEPEKFWNCIKAVSFGIVLHAHLH